MQSFTPDAKSRSTLRDILVLIAKCESKLEVSRIKLCQMSNFSQQRVLKKVQNNCNQIDRKAIYQFL